MRNLPNTLCLTLAVLLGSAGCAPSMADQLSALSVADQLSKASNRTLGFQAGSFTPVVGPLFGAAAVASAVDEQIDAANKSMKTGYFSKAAKGIEPFSKTGKQAVSVALPFGKDITDEVIDAIVKSGDYTTDAGYVMNPEVLARMLEMVARGRPRN